MGCARTSWLVLLLACPVVGALVFSSGFFLTRRELAAAHTCSTWPSTAVDFPTRGADFGGAWTSKEGACWMPARFERLVVLVIDAWRFDFADPAAVAGGRAPDAAIGQMPRLAALLDNSRSHAASGPTEAAGSGDGGAGASGGSVGSGGGRGGEGVLLEFVADAPTVTMQRLKGLMGGGLPTFLDMKDSFASDEITEDNLVHQFQSCGKDTMFVGDDTWERLFPGRFNASFAYPSFNVKDLHTVDNGVINRMVPAIVNQSADWDVIVGHSLGVDHVGHRHGPGHPAMRQKLAQMDELIDDIAGSIDDKTLLAVFGDHGMTNGGNHGGSSADETTAALFLYAKHAGGLLRRGEGCGTGTATSCGTKRINQVDIVPTLALLVGVPIPFGSLGTIIPNLAYGSDSASGSAQLHSFDHAMKLNAAQVLEYLQEYQKMSGSLPLDQLADVISAAQRVGDADSLAAFTQAAGELCRQAFTQFDYPVMLVGIVCMVTSAAGLLTFCFSTDVVRVTCASTISIEDMPKRSQEQVWATTPITMQYSHAPSATFSLSVLVIALAGSVGAAYAGALSVSIAAAVPAVALGVATVLGRLRLLGTLRPWIGFDTVRVETDAVKGKWRQQNRLPFTWFDRQWLRRVGRIQPVSWTATSVMVVALKCMALFSNSYIVAEHRVVTFLAATLMIGILLGCIRHKAPLSAVAAVLLAMIAARQSVSSLLDPSASGYLPDAFNGAQASLQDTAQSMNVLSTLLPILLLGSWSWLCILKPMQRDNTFAMFVVAITMVAHGLLVVYWLLQAAELEPSSILPKAVLLVSLSGLGLTTSAFWLRATVLRRAVLPAEGEDKSFTGRVFSGMRFHLNGVRRGGVLTDHRGRMVPDGTQAVTTEGKVITAVSSPDDLVPIPETFSMYWVMGESQQDIAAVSSLVVSCLVPPTCLLLGPTSPRLLACFVIQLLGLMYSLHWLHVAATKDAMASDPNSTTSLPADPVGEVQQLKKQSRGTAAEEDLGPATAHLPLQSRAMLPIDVVLLWWLCSAQYFFASGHHTSFSSIDFMAAFVAFDDVNWILGGASVVHHTLFAVTFAVVTLPMLLVTASAAKQSRRVAGVPCGLPAQVGGQTIDVPNFEGAAHHLIEQNTAHAESAARLHLVAQMAGRAASDGASGMSLLRSTVVSLAMLQLLQMVCTMIFVTLESGHLMVWAIFAPKLIFEASITLFTFLLSASVLIWMDSTSRLP